MPFRPSCWPRCSSGSSGRGLLVSVQGTRGGYKLGRPAMQMTVADVIQAIDGPVAVTACSPTNHTCEQFDHCEIRDPLWKIKARIVDALATVSLAELAEPVAAAEAVPVPLTVTPSRTASRLGD